MIKYFLGVNLSLKKYMFYRHLSDLKQKGTLYSNYFPEQFARPWSSAIAISSKKNRVYN